MNKLIVLITIITFSLVALVTATTVNATREQKDPNKSVTITESCDKTADVSIYGGNTRRTWSVNGDKKWVEFYATANWESIQTPVAVQWYHENSDAWKDADPSYVTTISADNCPVVTPEATPSATPATPTATVLPQTGSWDWTWPFAVVGIVLLLAAG